jgi:hypothetical protein
MPSIFEVWEMETVGTMNKVFNVIRFQDGRLEAAVHQPGLWHCTLRLLATAYRVADGHPSGTQHARLNQSQKKLFSKPDSLCRISGRSQVVDASKPHKSPGYVHYRG